MSVTSNFNREDMGSNPIEVSTTYLVAQLDRAPLYWQNYSHPFMPIFSRHIRKCVPVILTYAVEILLLIFID